MAEGNFTKDNHYLSQAYLKNWELSPGKVFAYHTLVSHENVPLWAERNIKGIGYHQHLYTRLIAGTESDEIERWFSAEFESPAELPIQKVINEDRLVPEDWDKLVRFLAMHDVRTPARLMDFLQRNTEELLKKALAETMEDLPEELERIKNQIGVDLPAIDKRNMNFPLKVTTEKKEGDELVTVKAEAVLGRAAWLWLVEHFLNNTTKVLHRHKWTIMHPAKGMSWFTTDKPVIRLNYKSPKRYDFNGGLANKGTQILMPLSPGHLLYTRIGDKPPMRGTRCTVEQTNILRRLIGEHAYRYVFAGAADPEVAIYKPRIVNAELYKDEQEQWRRWHAEQTEAEQYLFGV